MAQGHAGEQATDASTQICSSHLDHFLQAFPRMLTVATTPSTRVSSAGIALSLAVTLPHSPGSLCSAKFWGTHCHQLQHHRGPHIPVQLDDRIVVVWAELMWLLLPALSDQHRVLCFPLAWQSGQVTHWRSTPPHTPPSSVLPL